MEKNLSITELKTAFSKTPEEIVKYFESKGIKLSEDWKQTAKIIKQNAFAVSGVMNMDILIDFKAMIDDAISNRITKQEFLEQMRDKIQKSGWVGKEYPEKQKHLRFDNPWRVSLIIDQNRTNAFQEGRMFQAFDTISTRPYIQFWSTIGKTTTKECRGLHLYVMRLDDPKLKYFLQPGHFRCRRRAITLTQKQVDDGNLVITKGSSIMNLKNQPGFIKKPGAAWKPDLTGYPAPLKSKYNKFIKGAK